MSEAELRDDAGIERIKVGNTEPNPTHLGFSINTRSLQEAVKRVALSGSPAVVGLTPGRPMTLRPPLSRGMPFTD